ncbi:putative ABC transport system permease protein [Nitrosospira sp. Nsp5]|uniref:ABC transport system permease protein n=1 Tax=Nitrosospira multiformis TaxID=1231 RepID=A0ABY0TAY0_9PROT|nr:MULTISPECIES: FtsX-like permease family protein [Nitrosospira]PTR09474.1 putative ABC transport system permease protein [Nitrosospira sp. Nsp5]SDQ29144.1 putative ABC transport system permease protein [Nitrosospira multiformis]
MHFLKLILRNTLRHKLRTSLTVLGLVVAILAFGLLRTVVDAWYAGAEGASSARLVTRNAISLVFPLPINYQERIRRIQGVTAISHASWFGGVYVTPKNFFPQFAVDAKTYFNLYPEYLIPPADMKAFLTDRKGCVIGRKLANTYGFKIGDIIPLRGTIYPGAWSFTVRAIYDGAEAGTDTSQFFFHWDYLNETMKKAVARRIDWIGVYVIEISDPDRAAEISTEVDTMFRNSLAETLTETEKAFQLGFVSMTEAIVVAIRIVSFLVIFIILAVMANTMAMTARERIAEYATLKALGFGPYFLAGLIYGESLAIALAGAVIGILLTFPVADRFSEQVGTLFPVFGVSLETVYMQAAAAIAVGITAAILPAFRAARVPIVEGLRSIG